MLSKFNLRCLQSIAFVVCYCLGFSIISAVNMQKAFISTVTNLHFKFQWKYSDLKKNSNYLGILRNLGKYFLDYKVPFTLRQKPFQFWLNPCNKIWVLQKILASISYFKRNKWSKKIKNKLWYKLYFFYSLNIHKLHYSISLTEISCIMAPSVN